MSLIYVTENLVNLDTLCCVSSEDSPYVKEWLYNVRPSKPLRFEGKGVAPGNVPEWICIAFAAPQLVTFWGNFKHNFTDLSAGGDELTFKGCADVCEGSGSCDWNAPDEEIDLSDRIISNFRNSYKKVNMTYQYYRQDIIDSLNDYNLEVGELVLGQWQQFTSDVHLQPGRPDGPKFYKGDQKTHAGQPWFTYYSESETFTLTFMNVQDPAVVDEIHAFLKAVQRAGGTFVIVPDDNYPFCYYVYITNVEGYANRLYHGEKDLREWKIELETLPEGRRLL